MRFPTKRVSQITAGMAAGLLCIALGFGTWNYVRPLPVLYGTPEQVAAVAAQAVMLSWPNQGQAAVGADGFGLLAAHGDQTPLPIASVAKVITALAVTDKLPLQPGEPGRTFTVGPADVALYEHYVSIDGSVARVTNGEQLTEYQALQALLLPSANNIADSLAVWVFGSMDAYHTYANQLVQGLGATHTTVAVDASGFAPDTVSTATDLILIGQALMQEPVLAEIVNQQTAVIPVAGAVHNVNWLLGQDGVIGIKTGNTDEAGGCFLGAATHQLADGRQLTVFSAVLGTPQLNSALDQTMPLLQSAKNNLTSVTIIKKGQVLGTYQLPWGGAVQATAKQDLTLPIWRGDSRRTTIALNTVQPSAQSGAVAGKVSVTAGKQTGTADVTLQTTVPAPSFWWRVTRF